MARLPVTAENISPLKATFKVVLNAENVGLTAEQFVRLCHDNPELRFELTARKEIIVMAPTHSKTGARNFNISNQLGVWTEQNGTGIGFDSNTGFTLPNGAIRSPDASWIRLERWNALSEKEQNSFGPICPDFVIELRSESNTLRELQGKMSEYMDNGAKLGFLIDPYNRTVDIYRSGKPPERLDNPPSVTGDPELPGFKLDLAKIW